MNVGLLGAGHIARALAEGWSLHGDRPGRPERLTFFDVVPDAAAALAADTGGVAADDAVALVEASDTVIVAVRPPHVEPLLTEIGSALGDRALVSVAAAVRLARLTSALPAGARVGRVMPNVAAALGLGVFLFAPGTLGSARDGVAELFGAAGTVVELEEEWFDLGTAVTGCMPGYVGRLVEAFADAGAARGLQRDAAVRLAAAGMHGAAAYVAAAGDPAAVAAAVGSPGSMTAAGIAALDAHDIRGVVDAAVDAAVTEASRLA